MEDLDMDNFDLFLQWIYDCRHKDSKPFENEHVLEDLTEQLYL